MKQPKVTSPQFNTKFDQKSNYNGVNDESIEFIRESQITREMQEVSINQFSDVRASMTAGNTRSADNVTKDIINFCNNSLKN